MRYAVCLVLVWGCDSVGDFQCSASKTCTPGYCESTGFCSFDDPTCASGRRYGDYAGNGLAGSCVVAGQNPDGAMPDASNLPDGQTPDAPMQQYNPPWWDTGYKKRQQLTITAPAAVPSGFQVGWQLDVEALIGAGGDWAQIRVVRYSGGNWTEMNRILDPIGAHREWNWIKLAAAIAAGGTDTTYWLYYDNIAPGAAVNDPFQVFDFYDPFSSTTLGTAWTTQGSVGPAGGELQVGAGGAIRTISHWSTGQAVDWAMRMPTLDYRFWCGFQIDNGTTGFNDDAPWVIWIARGTNAFIWPEYVDGASANFTGSNVTLDTANHIYGVERLSDRVVYRYDDVEVPGYTMAAVTTPLVARMSNETAQPIYSNMMRIRKSVHPYPTVVMGSVETHP